MKKTALLTATVLSIATFAGTACADSKKGEAIFKEKCAMCHPDGGNIMNPKATLKGLKDKKAIVAKIRKGGGGMSAYDQKAISDKDAKEVAEYIVKTFKK
jgi:cytochrome c6